MIDKAELVETYRFGKKSNLWMAFTPSGSEPNRIWHFQLTARNRGGSKTLATLWETTPLKPIGSVTLKGETYPLTVSWRRMKRGGVICIGGERKIGAEGGTLWWEMQLKPFDEISGCYSAEVRLRSTPRRDGKVILHLYTPVYRPEVISLTSAAARGHCAMFAWSSYYKYGAGFVMLTDVDDDAGWEESRGGFTTIHNSFPLGGGKAIRFFLTFTPSDSISDARQQLTEQYSAIASTCLHREPVYRPLTPLSTVNTYAVAEKFYCAGIERLYPIMPNTDANQYYAGHPHYPLDMLMALWDWQRLNPHVEILRLVRFGAFGLCADFQVMGHEGQPEPNKGAFWDKQEKDVFSDYNGQPSHGIGTNARIARALFLLHDATGEKLFLQSALNICQWLILKHNELGYYSGDRTYATLGKDTDGKLYGDKESLDGVLSIRAFVLAYHATNNEVFIKVARKIADYMCNWMDEYEPRSHVAAAGVILSMLAMDAEAPVEMFKSAIREWGAWLRIHPIAIGAGLSNYDTLHAGIFDVAQAGFRLHALDSDPDFLLYGFSALSAIPKEDYFTSWRAIRLYFDALLSVTAILPGLLPDFDNIKVIAGWKEFTPDASINSYLKVTTDKEEPVDYLPLVCHANDQLLIVALTPPDVESIRILKNGKIPLVRDLISDSIDNVPELHKLIDGNWAKVGIYTIDP